MKSIAKNNYFNTIIQRFGENLKGFSSILMGNLPQSNEDISLDDFSESNPDIIDELKRSADSINRKANDYALSIGIPSKKVNSKTSVNEPKSTVFKPITKTTIDNDRNITLMKNNGFER